MTRNYVPLPDTNTNSRTITRNTIALPKRVIGARTIGSRNESDICRNLNKECIVERPDLVSESSIQTSNHNSMPSLPVQASNQIIIDLNNSVLSAEALNIIYKNPNKKINIHFISGTDTQLSLLFEQLADFNNEISVNILNCSIDYSTILPWDRLGNNVHVWFGNATSFYYYLLNLYNELFNGIEEKGILNSDTITSLKREREILNKFNRMLKTKKNLLGAPNKVKMDYLYDYIKSNYPYDFDIVGRRGEYVFETEQGATIEGTFTRGKGVCTGRSKLLRAITNSRLMEVPCYLASGDHGNLGHAWNEFIDDNGEVLEYDLSFNVKGQNFNQLPLIYKNLCHEQKVEDALKKKYIKR